MGIEGCQVVFSTSVIRSLNSTDTKDMRVLSAQAKQAAGQEAADAAADARVAALLRARSHCRSALLLIHFTPESLTYSVPLFPKRQCDRTLGGAAGGAAAGGDAADPGLPAAGRGGLDPHAPGRARPPGRPSGSVALSLCTAAHPLHTRFTKIIGASFLNRPTPFPTAGRLAEGALRRADGGPRRGPGAALPRGEAARPGAASPGR